MYKQPSIISDKGQLHSRDKRIGIMIFCAIALWGFLSFKMLGNDFIPAISGPSVQLISRAGSLSLESPETSQGRSRDNFREPDPDLAPFFFQPIPVNFADAKLIETINGIGPHLAQKIVQTRNTHGFFASANDLMVVPGIGPKRIRQLENQLSFRTNP